MKRILFILIMLCFYSGCSSVSKNIEVKQFDCEKKVNPKSLQFLEQQYCCRSYQ